METTIKKIIIFSSIGVLSGLIMFSNDAQAKSQDEKTETFKQDGMTFVIGKHEPDKRKNPEEDKKIIEKVIIKEKIIERVVKPNNQHLEEAKKLKEEETINQNSEEQEEVSDNGIMKFIKDSLSTIEKKIENILTKLGLVEDKLKNVDELVDTTSKITDEVTKQDERINKLEDELLKKQEHVDQKIKIQNEDNVKNNELDI